MFSKRFILSLEQDIKEPADTASAATPEEQAMASTLETASPDELGADAGTDVLQARAKHSSEMINHVREWVFKIEKFTKFLNDPMGGSIQAALSKAIPDTILDKIRTTETKKIARTAQDLAGLCESLKGYLATAHDPKYRGS